MQHGAQPLGPLRPGGQAEVEPGAGDGLLGPADPLGHRRLGDPERRGDLRRGQAADRAQRQRDLAGRGQVRMAAAEQQGQRVVAVGGSASAGGPSSSDGGVATATSSSRARRDCSLRTWSISRREATVISQPRGLSGSPSDGHCCAAASRASWLASSHRWNCPYRRTSAARTCGASSRSRPSTSPRLGGHRSGLASCRIGQNSTGSTSAKGMSAAIWQRALLALAVEQVEAGDVLLGLQVRPVGHGGLAVLPPHQPGLDLVGQPVGADELAGRLVLAVERVLPGDGLRPLRRPGSRPTSPGSRRSAAGTSPVSSSVVTCTPRHRTEHSPHVMIVS